MPMVEGEEPWELLFSPKDFSQENPDMELENFRIDVQQLKEYANYISAVRTRIRELAMQQDSIQPQGLIQHINATNRVAKKISR